MANSKTMTIAGYKPFWLYVGSTPAWVNTKTAYGMIAKENPFPLIPEPKDVYSNDWKDEDGIEEYVGAIKYKPLEFDVTFYIREEDTQSKTAAVLLREDVEAFFNAVKGSDFKIFDDFNGRGYQNVRYIGYSKESETVVGSVAKAVIKVSFRANDPITTVIGPITL